MPWIAVRRRRRAVLTVLLLHPAAAAATTLPPLKAKPITGPWPAAFPAKDLCSNCGLCQSAVGVTSVTEACAFIGDGMSRAEALEPRVHGRARRYSQEDLSEAHFGVHSTIALARGVGVEGAQWTGVATSVATAWLASGRVDAVVVAGSGDASSFGAPEPVLCRTADEVLRGRRVKPSLCPSLAVLDEVRDDASITRLLFCGVGCAVQALRSLNGGNPEAALGLEEGGLFILGTHCVDNSPTPDAARRFVSAIPGIGAERADDVLAYEFMADFRVHARLKPAGSGAYSGEEDPVVKQAYMTLPPSLGIPSIAPSCFACFDYTNGLADLVVGYMGAPFDAADEMTSAALMVTVRNGKGQAMLDEAVRAGRVEILQDGGHGGASLPSSGERGTITMKTVEQDSMVKSLTEAEYVPLEQGAPPLIGNLLATIISKGLPKGLEFGRFSIDYHYLRNLLYVEAEMRPKQAARHVPKYARAVMERYGGEMAALREAAAAMRAGVAPRRPPAAANYGPLAPLVEWLALLGLIV